MILGLLADSHGRRRTTSAAVTTLIERGAETLIHLGDFGTVEVIEELVGRNAQAVLGNCDFPPERFLRYAEHLGVTMKIDALRLEFAGKRLIATHGHIEHITREALADEVDYLLHGHSHLIRDERVGRTRIINPGALARAARYTAAVLDTAADHLAFIEIARDLD